jgi:transglutaminase-like putative cysteine protease
MEPMDRRYLDSTSFIDCDQLPVIEKAREVTSDVEQARERATRLFYFVRDEIRYNAFSSRSTDAHRASHVLGAREGYCVQKAVLLVALARAAGIHARLRFADIRAHLASPDLIEKRGSNLFAWHGLADLHVEGRWVKATPTYDKEFCRKAGVETVEFDGSQDAMLPAYALDGRPNVEYILDRGCFHDLPLDEIRKASTSWKYMAS